MTTREYIRRAGGVISFLFLAAVVQAATTYSTNIYTTSATYQTDLIAGVTTQFNTIAVKSKFDPNAYSINLGSETVPGTCEATAPCDLDADIATLVANSTYTYPLGWADGMSQERYNDVSFLSVFTSSCDFKAAWYPGIDTTTLAGLPAIDSTTCNVVLDYMGNFIYNQFYLPPQPVKGF